MKYVDLMKVSVLFMTLFLCICFMSVNASASNIAYDNPYFDGSDLDEEDYREANERLLQSGNNARKLREVYTLTMTKYMQTDSKWSGVQLTEDPTDTIGNVGCYLTSFAMIANYFEPNAGYNPLTVFQKLGSVVCPFNPISVANGMRYTLVNNITSNLTTQNINSYVCGAMQKGLPVMIVVLKTDGSQHCVVARGYSETSQEIYILDPGSSYINKLSSYTNAGARVIHLMIYEK